jgi:hypothetical protein
MFFRATEVAAFDPAQGWVETALVWVLAQEASEFIDNKQPGIGCRSPLLAQTNDIISSPDREMP